MEVVRWDRRPELRKPALVCSFKGWNDAAESATTALLVRRFAVGRERFGALTRRSSSTSRRPARRYMPTGVTREIEWPEWSFPRTSSRGARDLSC